MKENYNDLFAFVVIAQEGSFTRAAARLGVSQSALSHTMRALEERLGIQLLTRTTRSVSTTEAGARLLSTLTPRFEDIETELAALTELRDKPAGTVRISTAEHAIDTLIWPKLVPFLKEYPDINVEFVIDYGFADIVAQRLDAGVRLGDEVEKDMIAARIGPDMRMAVVATPEYFEHHPKPQTPTDLTEHRCINLRLPTYGGMLVWDFAKDGQKLNVKVDGQLAFNSITPVLRAALAGFGLAFVPDDMVESHIKTGELISVLEDWCPSFAGYHLYYPSRNSSPAFKLLLENLRYYEP